MFCLDVFLLCRVVPKQVFYTNNVKIINFQLSNINLIATFAD